MAAHEGPPAGKKKEDPMKRETFAIAAVLAFSIVAAAMSAPAQAPSVLVVNVPFEFVVGNQALPAGEYKIERGLSSRLDVLLIRRADGRALTYMLTTALHAKDVQPESKLIFNRYGNRYFLSQIWNAADQWGRELSKSPREKEMALTEVKHEVVLLARSPSATP
jgi:hypothetical protein